MSSRSNGVTKLLFTLRTMAWVFSSQTCSASRIRLATSGRSAPSEIISARSPAPVTRCCAEMVNSS